MLYIPLDLGSTGQEPYKKLPEDKQKIIRRIEDSVMTPSAKLQGMLRLKLNTRLVSILEQSDWSIEGKHILDLGCGSRLNPDESGQGKILYEPWLSRALHNAGAIVTGVDVHPQVDEKFTHYQRDLCKKDSLSVIPKKSIDIACMFSVCDSPHLRTTLMESGSNLLDQIRPQLDSILKAGGTFIYEMQKSYKGSLQLEKDEMLQVHR